MSLLQQAPRFDLAGAARLARAWYRLDATAAVLPSERDQNFLLTTASGDRYVLKVANATESRQMLEAQNAAMTHVASRVALCPRVVPTIGGDTIGIASNDPHPPPLALDHRELRRGPPKRLRREGGQTHFVRLVTHLAGVPLATVRTRDPALLDSLGRAVGRLDGALADFDHRALHRDFHWDLANASRVIGEHLPRIRDEREKELVARVSGSSLEWITSGEAAFRRSVIHNDANDWNVLIADGEVVGVIDFGDMVHSWTVADPAVAIAYAMLDAEDPLETAAAIVRGYHAEYPLRGEELAALFPLAVLRVCMSVCLAAWQQQQRPDDEYLVVSQAPIQRTLPRVADIAPSVAERTIRDACA